MEDGPRAEPSISEQPQLLVEDEDLDPDDSPDEYDNVSHQRQRRQSDASTTFEDQVILLALENENACNPVLRASANAILER